MQQSQVQSKLHEKILLHCEKVADWFQKKSSDLSFPIYSSYDIRDAGYKVTNVDANIFPAGFNNICPNDQESSVELMSSFLNRHYGNDIKKVALVTEEHTGNPFYWQNITSLKTMLNKANRETLLLIPRPLEIPLQVQNSQGQALEVQGIESLKGFAPDLVISNNDFSEAYEDWASHLQYPMNPPRELGWYQRKKSRYFSHFNRLIDEFSELVGFDPWLLKVETEIFEGFEITDDSSRDLLAARVDSMIANLKSEYQKRGIDQTPFVFVKNNSGTYGLAVIRVGSGEEVKAWNYKSRKKMKASKGGRDVEEVIIQEGIPSIVKAETSTAEPVIYMIGCELAGGFLRTHGEKDSTESLNSPGAVYKKLCVSDLAVNTKGCPMENVYGWSAKMGSLAIALEAKEMGVTFKNYRPGPCGQKG